MGWILILLGIVVLFVILKFIHFRNFAHKLLAVVLIALLFIVLSTFFSIANNNSVDLKSASGIYSAGKVYLAWLGQTFGNLKTLTSNAVKMDWIPKNVSFAGG